MARMIPHRPHPDTQSRAELRLFEAWQRQLPDDYVVFHSVWWQVRNTTGGVRDGEADFLLVHPDFGVLIVEVKGGRIRYDGLNNQWFSNENPIKDPFKQGREAKYSLLDKLKELPYWRDRWITVGYSVAFPDVTVKSDLRLDAPRQLILDASDMTDLRAWVDQAQHYLQARRPDDSPPGLHGVEDIPHYMAVQRQRDPRLRQALVVIDGLALDQWRVARDVWAAEPAPWSLEEGLVWAWAPTLTAISRQALFAGTPPQLFPTSWNSTNQDASRWQQFWTTQGLQSSQVTYLRNLGTRRVDAAEGFSPGEEAVEPEVIDVLADRRVQVMGLVVNTVDNIAHGMQLGPAGMHQQVRLWLTRTRYLTNLVARLLDESL